MNQRQRANELVVKLMDTKKKPLDDERAKLSAELKALVQKAEDEQREIRARLKELNDLIAPIDATIVDISQAGKLTNQAIAKETIDKLEAAL